MFSIFGQHNTKGSIELDASLVRYFEDIQKKFDLPQNLKKNHDLRGGIK